MKHRRSDGNYYRAVYEDGLYYVELVDTNDKILHGYPRGIDLDEAEELIQLLLRNFSEGSSGTIQLRHELSLAAESIETYLSIGRDLLRNGETVTSVESVVEMLKEIRSMIRSL